jgi:hypothetical protein
MLAAQPDISALETCGCLSGDQKPTTIGDCPP